MASSDDEAAFNEIVKRELMGTPVKGLFDEMAGSLAMTAAALPVGLLRLGFAIYGLVVWGSLVATLVIAGLYGCRILAGFGLVMVGFIRGLAERASGQSPAGNDPQEMRKRQAQRIEELERPRTKRQIVKMILGLVWPLGTSALAAVGVAALLGLIPGVVAGLLLFGFTVYLRVTARKRTLRMMRPMQMMTSNDPRDTPEI